MRPLLRRSATGALLGGAFFLGLGMYMNRAIGAGPLEHLGPLGFTVVVGATIGGLVAPLFRWRRGRGQVAVGLRRGAAAHEKTVDDVVDRGLTHVALEVTDLDRSIEFYARYAKMEVVHRRARTTDANMEIAWLSDRTRPFVVVLMEASRVERTLGPFAHLGVACSTRAELERQCALAAAEGCLREPLRETGGPAGCLAMLSDPDGHTLELSHGQEVGVAVESREGDDG
jgi:catechol 2,3-dioxygenase-like lactoylglutathione lyase family enzyme